MLMRPGHEPLGMDRMADSGQAVPCPGDQSADMVGGQIWWVDRIPGSG
ncbi:hypothetical protein [Candidatus Oscillochloris fontis]|nr:hypothetical protein [Candidatus Oscillochloris fontis]